MPRHFRVSVLGMEHTLLVSIFPFGTQRCPSPASAAHRRTAASGGSRARRRARNLGLRMSVWVELATHLPTHLSTAPRKSNKRHHFSNCFMVGAPRCWGRPLPNRDSKDAIPCTGHPTRLPDFDDPMKRQAPPGENLNATALSPLHLHSVAIAPQK